MLGWAKTTAVMHVYCHFENNSCDSKIKWSNLLYFEAIAVYPTNIECRSVINPFNKNNITLV